MEDSTYPAAIQFACVDNDLLVPSKDEAMADRWASERALPLDWTKKLIERHIAAGGVVDAEFISELAQAVGLRDELVARWIAAREGSGQGSSEGRTGEPSVGQCPDE